MNDLTTMPSLIGRYKNGNYDVRIYSDGTKVRDIDDEEPGFLPEFPESIDLKITNKCGMGCPFCHENSTPDGKHGDIMHLPFIKTLHPYTEVAIGGGDPLSHPDLVPFLSELRELQVLPNITVNAVQFMENHGLLQTLAERKLLYGIGVSYTRPEDVDIEEFINAVKPLKNAVIHVINGVISREMLQNLKDNDLKILILGYKDFRRGSDFWQLYEASDVQKQEELYELLPTMVKEGWFSCISFDNLAIEQLDVKRLMSKKMWKKFYMGNDGEFTMYVDAVNEKYAVSSVSEERCDLCDSIDEMFANIQYRGTI